MQRHTMAPNAPRKCSGNDCESDAGSLQCPNCQKLAKESYFCTQECFKRNWVLDQSPSEACPRRLTETQGEHKKQHKSQSSILQSIFTPKVVSYPDPETGHFNPFPTFPYTGALRPVYPLSARREVPKSIKHPDYAKDGIPRSEQVFANRNKIAILNKEEQEGMRKVCRLGREVLDIAARAAKPGVTTDYIDEIVHKACMERNVSVGRPFQDRTRLTRFSPTHRPSTTAISPNPYVRPSTRLFATAFPISGS